MLKKEKPMMTVAAIIEQAQSRWMDQHPLQVYNRAFQGSYCKYYCILLFVYSEALLFLHHPIPSIHRSGLLLPSRGSATSLDSCNGEREMGRAWICVIQLCAHDNIRKNVGLARLAYENRTCLMPSIPTENSCMKREIFVSVLFFSNWRPRSITSANKISIESQFVRCASCPTGALVGVVETPSTTSLRMAFR